MKCETRDNLHQKTSFAIRTKRSWRQTGISSIYHHTTAAYVGLLWKERFTRTGVTLQCLQSNHLTRTDVAQFRSGPYVM